MRIKGLRTGRRAVAALCLPRRSFAKAGERRRDEGKFDSSAVIDRRYNSYETTSKSRAAAFSLVEVTLALGVAAFCLLAVLGLLPVGVQTNRNASSQTIASNIIATVVSDLRTTPAHVIGRLKRDEAAALNATLLHELYFASLGGDGRAG